MYKTAFINAKDCPSVHNANHGKIGHNMNKHGNRIWELGIDNFIKLQRRHYEGKNETDHSCAYNLTRPAFIIQFCRNLMPDICTDRRTQRWTETDAWNCQILNLCLRSIFFSSIIFFLNKVKKVKVYKLKNVSSLSILFKRHSIALTWL